MQNFGKNTKRDSVNSLVHLNLTFSLGYANSWRLTSNEPFALSCSAAPAPILSRYRTDETKDEKLIRDLKLDVNFAVGSRISGCLQLYGYTVIVSPTVGRTDGRGKNWGYNLSPRRFVFDLVAWTVKIPLAARNLHLNLKLHWPREQTPHSISNVSQTVLDCLASGFARKGTLTERGTS